MSTLDAGRVAWAAGGYAVGTVPCAYLVAKLRNAPAVIELARHGTSATDAHVLLNEHAGKAWGAVAAGLDVAKALGYMLAARFLADLPPEWVALTGVLVVLGHSFPFYLRELAGRGLAAAAGVLLAVIPLSMVVAGVLILCGIFLQVTGPMTTVGLALTPVIAALQGEPGAIVAMAGAIFGLIMARRLLGVRGAAEVAGWPRAIVRRLVFDDDRPVADDRATLPAPR